MRLVIKFNGLPVFDMEGMELVNLLLCSPGVKVVEGVNVAMEAANNMIMVVGAFDVSYSEDDF